MKVLQLAILLLAAVAPSGCAFCDRHEDLCLATVAVVGVVAVVVVTKPKDRPVTVMEPRRWSEGPP